MFLPKTNYIIFAVLTAVICGWPGVARSETALDLLKKADKVGYTNTSKIAMSQTVVSPSGETRTFKMISYSAGGTEKGMTHYLSPQQVRGMQILTLNDGDDIWTYFPRTNRTRKIASSARNRKVQGSDFTYDDMATGKLAESWTGKVVGVEKVAGQECHKLALAPTKKGPKSYSKAILWISKKDFTTARVEYFDTEGDKIKRLDIEDYRLVSGVLIPFRYTMTSLLDGGKTIMQVEGAKANVEIDGNFFSESQLGKSN